MEWSLRNWRLDEGLRLVDLHRLVAPSATDTLQGDEVFGFSVSILCLSEPLVSISSIKSARSRWVRGGEGGKHVHARSSSTIKK